MIIYDNLKLRLTYKGYKLFKTKDTDEYIGVEDGENPLYTDISFKADNLESAIDEVDSIIRQRSNEMKTHMERFLKFNKKSR